MSAPGSPVVSFYERPRSLSPFSLPLLLTKEQSARSSGSTGEASVCPEAGQPASPASFTLCNCIHASTFAAAAESFTQVSSFIVAFIEGVSIPMRSVYEERLERATKNARAIVQDSARTCKALNFGKVCKALWPFKTAEELATRVGCSPRAASYEISGERHPSAQSLLAVMREITPEYGAKA